MEMGLLGKKICAGCGKETGIMSFTFKADKQHLCRHCVAKMPVDDIRAYAKKIGLLTILKTLSCHFWRNRRSGGRISN